MSFLDDINLMYLRKSRADNPQESVEEVLARHERQLQELSIKLTGHPVPEKYIFREVVSGETIEDRPEIKKVLAAIEEPSVKGVLVIEPQRLSRGDWEDGGKILSSFRYSSTLIITPQKTYNLHDKFDYRFFKMELAQGNDYLEYTKEILSRGRLASVKEGNYIGSVAPYGYRKVSIDNKPTLIPYEPEAHVVRLAVQMRIKDNMGWSHIAHALDAAGYVPRKGGHWSPYTLRDICINPVNIGKIQWNSRKTVKVYDDGRLKVTRPRSSDPLLIDGRHEPILDIDTYRKLVAVSGRTTKERKHVELKNPLAGLIFCGTCGHAMVYRTYKSSNGTAKSSPRLLCTNQVHCGTKSAQFSVIYDIVLQSLESIVSDFTFRLSHDQGNAARDTYAHMLAEAMEERKKLEIRQEELYDLLEDHTYTRDVFLKRNKKLEKDRENLEKRIIYLNDHAPRPVDYRRQIQRFNDVISSLRDPDITAKEKNTMLKDIVSRIDYYRSSENRTKWDTSKPTVAIKLRDF